MRTVTTEDMRSVMGDLSQWTDEALRVRKATHDDTLHNYHESHPNHHVAHFCAHLIKEEQERRHEI